MKRRSYVNTAAATTLASTMSVSSTSVNVTSASGWPTTEFTTLIENELVLVASRSGNTLSGLTRGYGDTIAVTHSTGVTADHVAIADDFGKFPLEVRFHPAGDTLDDEFDDDSLDGALTTVTPTGTASWSEGDGQLGVEFYSQTASDVVGIVKTIGSLTPAAEVTTYARRSGYNSYSMSGVVLADGTTANDKVVLAGTYTTAATTYSFFRSGTWTNVANTYSNTLIDSGSNPWYSRLRWVAINQWEAEWSIDGVVWTDLGVATQAYTMVPTHVGLWVSSWGGTSRNLASFDYLRVKPI